MRQETMFVAAALTFLLLGPAHDEPRHPACVLYREGPSIGSHRYCVRRTADGTTIISRDSEPIAELSTTPCGLSNVVGQSLMANLYGEGVTLHLGELPADPDDVKLFGRSGQQMSWAVLDDGVRELFVVATSAGESPRLVIDERASPAPAHCR